VPEVRVSTEPEIAKEVKLSDIAGVTIDNPTSLYIKDQPPWLRGLLTSSALLSDKPTQLLCHRVVT